MFTQSGNGAAMPCITVKDAEEMRINTVWSYREKRQDLTNQIRFMTYLEKRDG